jgi:hypothetical protein
MFILQVLLPLGSSLNRDKLMEAIKKWKKGVRNEDRKESLSR